MSKIVAVHRDNMLDRSHLNWLDKVNSSKICLNPEAQRLCKIHEFCEDTERSGVMRKIGRSRREVIPRFFREVSEMEGLQRWTSICKDSRSTSCLRRLCMRKGLVLGAATSTPAEGLQSLWPRKVLWLPKRASWKTRGWLRVLWLCGKVLWLCGLKGKVPKSVDHCEFCGYRKVLWLRCLKGKVSKGVNHCDFYGYDKVLWVD